MKAGVEMTRQRNASVDGIGSIYGGKLDNVSINGIGKVKGDTEVGCFDINGIGKATRKLIADTINNNGIGRLLKDIKAKKIINNGFLKIAGNLETEELVSEGLISIWGTANVGSFKVTFIKGSYINQVLGDEVEIKYGNDSQSGNIIAPIWIIRLMLGGKLVTGKFVCTAIECTSLQADNLIAETIRARDVVLGPNSEVKYLEYSNSFTAHESCVIKKIVKI